MTIAYHFCQCRKVSLQALITNVSSLFFTLLQRPDFKKIALKDVRRTLEEDPPTENQNVP